MQLFKVHSNFQCFQYFFFIYKICYIYYIIMLLYIIHIITIIDISCKTIIKRDTYNIKKGTLKDNKLFKFKLVRRILQFRNVKQKIWNASRFCVSSLRRGHANLLCIVPILIYVQPKLYNIIISSYK